MFVWWVVGWYSLVHRTLRKIKILWYFHRYHEHYTYIFVFKCTSCERSTSMPNMWTASLLLEFHLILFLRKYKKWTKNILHLKCITKMENKVKTSHENTTRHDDILYICLTKPHIDHYVIYFELANNDHVNSNNAKCNVSTWNNQRIIFFFMRIFVWNVILFCLLLVGHFGQYRRIYSKSSHHDRSGWIQHKNETKVALFHHFISEKWLSFNVQTICLIVMMPSRSAVT